MSLKIDRIVKRVLLAAWLFSTSVYASEQDYQILSEPKILPSFDLINHRGEAFTRAELENQWSLIFIGFTSCPAVCPMTLLKLEAARAELGLKFTPDKIPQIIFLAVDPKRDESVMDEYLAHFHPANVGITGKKIEIDRLVDGLDAFYRLLEPKPGSDYYDVQHTAAIAVVSPDAQLVAQINPPFLVQPMSQLISQIIRERSAWVSRVNYGE